MLLVFLGSLVRSPECDGEPKKIKDDDPLETSTNIRKGHFQVEILDDMYLEWPYVIICDIFLFNIITGWWFDGHFLNCPINLGLLIIPIDSYFSEGFFPWPTNQST